MRKIFLLLALLALVFIGCQSNSEDYQLVKTYPYPKDIFTQGLELGEDGMLYASIRLYEKYFLARLNLDGQYEKLRHFPPEYFLEGMTFLDDGRLWIFTYKENTAFLLDQNFNILKEASYESQGWGMA